MEVHVSQRWNAVSSCSFLYPFLTPPHNFRPATMAKRLKTLAFSLLSNEQELSLDVNIAKIPTFAHFNIALLCLFLFKPLLLLMSFYNICETFHHLNWLTWYFEITHITIKMKALTVRSLSVNGIWRHYKGSNNSISNNLEPVLLRFNVCIGVHLIVSPKLLLRWV